nr:carbohydrate-binding family 9-like protein [bacterium]
MRPSALLSVSLYLSLSSFAVAVAGGFPRPAIPFAPEQYICYRTAGVIQIDGLLEEHAWQSVTPTDLFVDIEGDRASTPRYETRARMLWDDEHLYISAELEEPDVWATLDYRDAIIYYDNDFELFIEPDGDTHHYYE